MNAAIDASFISHDFRGAVIPQRPEDGYINATAMCATEGKLFGHYKSLESTTAFLNALSLDIGIPISKIIETVRGRGDRVSQGTWVHPYVAINLAQWLSPEFAVQVSKWVFEWLSGLADLQAMSDVTTDHPNNAMTPLNVPQALAMVGMALEIWGKEQAAEVWHVAGLPIINAEPAPDAASVDPESVERFEPRTGTDEARILGVIRDAGEDGVVRSIITRRFRTIRAVDIDDILDSFVRAGLIRRVAAASAACRSGIVLIAI